MSERKLSGDDDKGSGERDSEFEDLAPTEDATDDVKGGKVAMQDFSFTTKVNKSSP